MSFNQNAAIGGLNSYAVAVPAAGPYFVKGTLSLPTIVNGGGASSVVVTITNGTGPVTIYTGVAGAEGFYTDTLCAANDVLTIALTSSNANDQGTNTVKAVVSIGSGQ
jgi:hypothetical protein